MIPLLVGAIAVLVLLVGIKLAMPRIAPLFVFHPEPLRPRESEPLFWGFPQAQELKLVTEDGLELHAWAFSADSAVPHRGSVAFFHGNAGHVAYRGEIGARFAALGLDALLIDYRGYGLSGGKPTEPGLYLDADAAYRALTEGAGIPPERLVIAGNSLGSSVAADLASRRPAAAVILLGALSSTPEIGRRAYPWLPEWMLDWDEPRFDAVERAPRIDAPVFVGVAAGDRVVPNEESRKVYDAVTSERAWYEAVGADHGTLTAHPGLWLAIDRFLHAALGPPVGEPRHAP